MNSLSAEILASLDNVEMSTLDANIAVQESMLDVYMKHTNLEIMYIQEGFEYEEGESMLKTIFLFIPRLIVNYFKSLMMAWKNIKISLLPKLAKSTEEKVENIEPDIIDQLVADSGRVRFRGKQIIVLTKFTSILDVIHYFDTIREAFQVYNEITKSDSPNFEAGLEAGDSIDIAELPLKKNVESDDQMTDLENDPTFIQGIEKLIEVVDTDTKTVETVFKRVQKWYYKMIKKDDVDANAGGLAVQFHDQIMRIYKQFMKDSKAITAELAATHAGFVEFNQLIDAFIKTHPEAFQ